MGTKTRPTRKYLQMVYGEALGDIQREMGTKGATVKLTVGMVSIGLIMGISTYLGFSEGWEESADVIINLFLGDAVILLVLWISSPVAAILRIPKIATEIDNNKTGQIARLMEKEPPELEKLADLKNEAVTARNEATVLTTDEEVKDSIDNLAKWVKRVRRQMKKISPAESSNYQSLNRWNPEVIYSDVVNEEHRQHLYNYDERIKRLQEFLNRRFGVK